jgi:hypothetical protein
MHEIRDLGKGYAVIPHGLLDSRTGEAGEVARCLIGASGGCGCGVPHAGLRAPSTDLEPGLQAPGAMRDWWVRGCTPAPAQMLDAGVW